MQGCFCGCFGEEASSVTAGASEGAMACRGDGIGRAKCAHSSERLGGERVLPPSLAENGNQGWDADTALKITEGRPSCSE